MKRLILVSALFIASCGYDGKYRYECQDPENWGKSECEPPTCEVDGACTKTLLGWDPTEISVDTVSPEGTTAP